MTLLELSGLLWTPQDRFGLILLRWIYLDHIEPFQFILIPQDPCGPLWILWDFSSR